MIKYLKNGRYFYQVNCNKIEEIEVKNASLKDGEVYYNDGEVQYDLARVLTKSEDKGFIPLKDDSLLSFHWFKIKGHQYSNGGFNLFINNDGKVEEHKFFVHQYDLSNRTLISLYYKTDEDKRVIVSEDKVFPTANLAKESRDFEVVNLDGTKEVTKGLLSMVKLSDEQQKMVATLKGLLMDMRGMGIEIIGDVTQDKMRFINTRDIQYYNGYYHDVPEDECYIPLDMLEGIDYSFSSINEDAEDALVVRRR